MHPGSDALVVVRFSLVHPAAEVSDRSRMVAERTDVFIDMELEEAAWML